MRAEFLRRHQKQREDQIELFLDAERPGVQQRLAQRRRVEIAGLPGKMDVRDRGRRRRQGPGVVPRFRRRQDEGGANGGRQQHGEKRGKNAQDAALVEGGDTEAAGLDVRRDHAGDEIARYDEEHVDADIAAAHEIEVGVVEHDRHDRDCPQSIDVRPVLQPDRLPTVWPQRRDAADLISATATELLNFAAPA